MVLILIKEEKLLIFEVKTVLHQQKDIVLSKVIII